jgi:glycine/D-amino acid oxidase-like deaminating enzyme
MSLVVVGGGVVGLACALDLRRAGAPVLLIDEGPNGRASPSASWGNAGHIAIEQVEPIASMKALKSAPARWFPRGGALDFRFGDILTWGGWARRYVQACSPSAFDHGKAALGALLDDAVPAWRRLVEAAGRPDLLREEGHIVVWESLASAEKGRAAWRVADIGQARTRDLQGVELMEVASRLGVAPAGGLRFENSGQISDPGLAMRTLREAFEALGGETRSARIKALGAENGRAVLTLENGEVLRPDQVVLAAGVGSGALMRGLGHVAPIVAERGYHIEGDVGAWGDLPPVVFEDRSMIVTRFGDRLRAASFVEFARRDTPADPRKWARLHRHVDELGLPMAKPRSQWMGARPTLPDYLPAIGVSRRAGNLIYAFGHQHLGLTLAATTGEIVTALAGGGKPAVDLTPFDLDRFSRRKEMAA